MLDKKDFSKSLFPELDEEALKKAQKESRRKWLAQKSVNFGLEYCSTAMFCGKYGIPLLKPYMGTIPKCYTTFGDITIAGDPNCCVTGCDYDYLIDRMWNNPDKYVEKLSRYLCITNPDYSLRPNHPLSVQIANVYRSHAVGFYMQEHSIPVLPSMMWSSTNSHEFCFDGFSKGGAVLVSTIGTLKDDRSKVYFRNGFEEMLKHISPDAVILYGDVNDELLSWLPKQLDIHHYDHNRFKRARNHGR